MGAYEDRQIAKDFFAKETLCTPENPPQPKKTKVESGKPRVNLGNLNGPEGNVYCVLGRCKEASRKAGWSDEQWDKFHTEATSGDYYHVLETVDHYFNASGLRGWVG